MVQQVGKRSEVDLKRVVETMFTDKNIFISVSVNPAKLGNTSSYVTGKHLVQTHLCVLVKRFSDFGSTSWQEIRSRHEEGCEYIRLPKGDNIEEDML